MPLAVAEFICSTSTGTQTITGSLGGATPVGVFFILSGATAVDTNTDHIKLCIGAASGSGEQWACTSTERDAIASSSAGRWATTAHCLAIIDPTSGSADGVATWDSFTTNGVVIDWSTTPPGSAYRGYAIFVYGTGTAAHAGSAAIPTTTGSTDVTAPGFEPDLVLLSSEFTSSTSISVYAYPSLGFVVNDGSNTQAGVSGRIRQGTAEEDYASAIRDGEVLEEVDFQSAAESYLITVNTFDANGFTINVNADVGAAENMYYFAVDLAGEAADVGIINTPTATGNQGYTGVGFEPYLVMLLMSAHTAVDTETESTDTGPGFGFGITDGTTEASVSYSLEHNAADMDCRTRYNTNLRVSLYDGSGASLASSLTSLDSDGFTLNFATVRGTARKFAYLAIGLGTITGSVSLARTAAMSPAGDAAATGSLTAARTMAMSPAGDALATAVLSLSRTMAVSPAGQAAAAGLLSLGLARGIAQGGQAAATAVLSLSRDAAISPAGQAAAGAALTLARTGAMSQPGIAAAVGLLDLALALGETWTGTQIGPGVVTGALTLARTMGLDLTGQAAATGSLSLGLDLALSESAQAAATGSLTLDQLLSIAHTAQAAATGSLALGRDAGLAELAQAAATGAVALDILLDMAASSGLQFPSILPSGRLVIIEAERIWVYIQTPTEERWISVPADDYKIK